MPKEVSEKETEAVRAKVNYHGKIYTVDKYINMIRKRAHYFARLYNIEYQELEDQGREIYCISLRDYDITKEAKFSTFLCQNLWGRLKDYCEEIRRDVIYDVCELQPALDIVNPEKSYDINLLKNIAKKMLSKNGYELFVWIVERDWEYFGCNKPSNHDMRVIFCGIKQWDISIFCETWSELKYFWNNRIFELANSEVLV
jgi:hypothetical protein